MQVVAAINDASFFGFCKFLQKFQESGSGGIIQEGQGLIEQNHLTVLGQASGEHYFLFNAIAQLCEIL